jgi:hypothetical protein
LISNRSNPPLMKPDVKRWERAFVEIAAITNF